MRMVLWSALAIVCLCAPALSQTEAPPDSLPALSPVSPADSDHSPIPLGSIKSSRVDTLSTLYKSTKSPGLALLFSAVLPGAGQFYNESYWKIPIVAGFGYYFVSRWFANNDSTKHYRGLYAGSVTADNPGGNGRYLQLREFYKDQRDTFSWYFFIFYVVNLVDAYVDASLYDFNVGNDLSIRVIPGSTYRPEQGVQLRLQLNLGSH